MNTLRQIGEYLGGQYARLLEMMATFQTRTGDTADNMTAFTEAAVRENIESGETHAILFGKIRKWFSSLGGLAFRDELEPLTAVYEGGEKIVYRGTEAVNLPIPGTGVRVVSKCSSEGGEYYHGFFTVKVGSRLRFEGILFGIPDSAERSAYLEKVAYDNVEGKWIPITNDPLPTPVKEKPSVVMGDEGFWRWRVDYEDLLAFEERTVYSDIFHVCVTISAPRFIALNPWSIATGYREVGQSGRARVWFGLYKIPETCPLRLLRNTTESGWVDVIGIGEGVEYMVRGGVSYACATVGTPGYYHLVATVPKGNATVEVFSDVFNLMA